MPPKKPAAVTEVMVSSSDALEKDEEKLEEKTDTAGAASMRRVATHPSTTIMVKEALKELDSRKGASSQAIQNYIKQTYPSVDLVRLKYLVRKALIKGLESGTLVRPANSTVANGAQGKFRLAPKKAKEPKPKTENSDPNVQNVTKATKGGAKKPKEPGATKKKDTVKKQKSLEDSKPTKNAKTDEAAATSKVAPAKKPKAKKVAEDGGGEEAPEPAKPKAKASKAAKGEKVSQSKAAKAADAPATKATGKRGKKTAE
ncbi:linker histone H1M [Centroberyx affinis]|uniref:linker histone H1M n=1 Tax=Centroberyx affinis TaxID=166261 RepID=UPI003A5BBD7A